VEGVHFDWRYLSASDVGWRSFQAAVSDVAAMGCTPIAALSSLALPAGTTSEGRGAAASSLKRAWFSEGIQQVFSSQPDSIGFGDAAGETELAALAFDDPLLDQARQVVLQALRHTAPVVGAVTMLRVRRSRSRAQLRALLPEVQARLSRPRHLADARLVIQRVEAMLSR
jgi:hypothetical protein